LFKQILFCFLLFQPPEFASGAIQSMADTKFCIDTLSRPKNEPIGIVLVYSLIELNYFTFPVTGIYYCAENKVRPQDNQHLTLRYYRDIALPNMQMCLDANSGDVKKPIVTQGCHNGQVKLISN
jgi:hypothetical protein